MPLFTVHIIMFACIYNAGFLETYFIILELKVHLHPTQNCSDILVSSWQCFQLFSSYVCTCLAFPNSNYSEMFNYSVCMSWRAVYTFGFFVQIRQCTCYNMSVIWQTQTVPYNNYAGAKVTNNWVPSNSRVQSFSQRSAQVMDSGPLVHIQWLEIYLSAVHCPHKILFYCWRSCHFAIKLVPPRCKQCRNI